MRDQNLIPLYTKTQVPSTKGKKQRPNAVNSDVRPLSAKFAFKIVCTVLYGLGDVLRQNGITVIEIGDRPRDTQYLII